MSATYATNRLQLTEGRRRSVRNPLEPEMIEEIEMERQFIINISPESFNVQRTHGVYIVKPCEDGEPFTVLEVHGRVEVCERGNDEGEHIVNRAAKIAADIVGEINGNLVVAGAKDPFLGAFVSDTANPKVGELEKQRKRYTAFQVALVSEARTYHSNPRDHQNITDAHRRAARVLQLTDEPWMFDAQPKISCPSCGFSIKPNLPKCAQCGAILDYVKMKLYFPLEYAELQAKGLIPSGTTSKKA